MRPRERRERGKEDLFHSRLDQIIDMNHAGEAGAEAMKPSDLARVVIDTTVQPKAVMFPTDAKLLNRARERLVRLAKKLGVSLRQSYRRVGKLALIPPARSQGLFPARTRGRVHRQGQGASALRVRGQSERRHRSEAFRWRPVCRPCRSVARQSL